MAEEQADGEQRERPKKEEIAGLLERIAALLETQGANRWRIQSYRDGARRLRQTERPVAEMADRQDMAALEEIPDIGEGLARVIVEYVNTGRSSLLEELQAEADPASLFATVPGIGEELAERIVAQLDVQTLAELEQAAHDGRLDDVPGFGPGRLKTVRTSLAGMLSGAAQSHVRQVKKGESDETARERPPVSLLLDVDETYREKAAAGELRKIAPKRFNPDNEAWLPILNMEREGWQFTVLYSNTARAHKLDKTDDWVVIYWQPPGSGTERQNTVVTGTHGPLKGARVVRGREEETRLYYREQGVLSSEESE